MHKVSGYLERATVIWEVIERVKSGKLNLDVVWIDPANAYGPVSHEMIYMYLVLRLSHATQDIQVMLDGYFSGFHIRFSTVDYTTNWIILDVVNAIECTTSPNTVGNCNLLNATQQRLIQIEPI
ncbi:reverse transcriptase [Elysia marginata]|uniref:Reverse transcriptase n=1 Tax=Elysia marginata TaxID=1093978 RepID=A0AAV4FZ00_9GAST|nr:reverse transcriptase [Elysia marginata]